MHVIDARGQAVVSKGQDVRVVVRGGGSSGANDLREGVLQCSAVVVSPHVLQSKGSVTAVCKRWHCQQQHMCM